MVKRRILAMVLVLCCVTLSGCDWLDRILDPPPDCPYPQFVCDVLDDVDTSDLGDRVQCVRDCLED